MGTNFYMMTKNKELAEKYAGWNYKLTDEPDWGYEIHIAKTSMGWLPLFQGYKGEGCIQSVKQLKEAYDTGEFIIYDEYNNIYNWEEFDERVLQFNGGKLGVQKPVKVADKNDKTPYVVQYIPISHLSGNKQSYAYTYGDELDYFADEEGYEFDFREFS